MKKLTLCGAVIGAGMLAATAVSAQEFTKTDHFVAYHPTVGGHTDHTVLPIYVRHVVSNNPNGTVPEEDRVILFIHGGTTPVAAGFDLDGYSWMEALAAEGFDVWAVDQSGYGGSARPNMDDPCNVQQNLQTTLLVGNIIDAECAPNTNRRFNTITGEWEEIDAAVDFILEVTGVDSVGLIGWSAGGPRSGGYAALHPEKVHRILHFAPVPPSETNVPVDVPAADDAMTTLRDRDGFAEGWAGQAVCENQIPDGAVDAYWDASMQWDAVGATWGPEGGVGYVRGPRRNGSWTTDMAEGLTQPILVIGGEGDSVIAPDRFRQVYDLAGSSEKVLAVVECGSHFLLWETDRGALHEASIEWFRDGTYQGATTGEFYYDAEGNITAMD